MLDFPNPETTRREFVRNSPIRLSDGADWGFARPALRLIPRVQVESDLLGRNVERVALDLRHGYSPLIEGLIDALGGACDHGSISEQYETFFSLAAELLLNAHDLTLQTACALLSVGDVELPRLINEVIAVITEQGDTPSANSPEISRHEPS